MKIIIRNYPLEPNLVEVMEEMEKLGSPCLHGVKIGFDGDEYLAIFDGSHRTIAAKKLGLIPNIILHEGNEFFLDFGDPVDYFQTVDDFLDDLLFKNRLLYIDFKSNDNDIKILPSSAWSVFR